MIIVEGGSGFWIDKGQITYPVNEITIADNLNEMFKKIILANDLEFKEWFEFSNYVN